MADYLVKLYDIPPFYPVFEELSKKSIVIRRPIGPENYAVIDWINEHFGSGWSGEAENAFFRTPKSIFIAVREMQNENGRIENKMLGFACYDATVRGFFGPTGVDANERHKGIGKGLLLACLNAIWDEGYGYAIIGSAGPSEFYEKVCGATCYQKLYPRCLPWNGILKKEWINLFIHSQ